MYGFCVAIGIIFLLCFYNYKCNYNMNIIGGTKYQSWLRHYAISWKVMGSNPTEVTALLSIYLILPATLWPRG
jgi:hypothetical protein